MRSVAEPTNASLAGRLVHDVGKYIARTARNVRDQAWTPELAAMLCRDLFELRGGRASVVFEALAQPVEARLGAQPALERARALLARIDASEADVRRGEPAACAVAGQLALAVDEALCGFARNLAEGTP